MTTADITRDVELLEWRAAVRAAREEGFTFFDWLSAVDQTDDAESPGFDVVCHLVRTGPWARVLLRTRVPDGISLESITGVFGGAAWHERETYEMFGVEFSGFDDGSGLGLRPLLLPEGFEGTPLRKSFVLASRASKAWPGAKEPGESEATPARASRRRRLLPPGVPDASWGPRHTQAAAPAGEER
ncbi:NADH-quinone oxidoreductase subunit C [Ornithinimicrobium sediminis]|uniref:NADH-quinone oxidoreductase subunit C n=1 Tax=Ornithinimicrobium sediminis TaxID=2904603 RepID=UPI001E475FA4|nr:NADH-quinone oxidoreductase subunit C [Ornithinimicrobium sediminis]MCE0486158.1 NADH-quinone oxidoreductase subunit C [Ornithinimicrobium sediminis]